MQKESRKGSQFWQVPIQNSVWRQQGEREVNRAESRTWQGFKGSGNALRCNSARKRSVGSLRAGVPELVASEGLIYGPLLLIFSRLPLFSNFRSIAHQTLTIGTLLLATLLEMLPCWGLDVRGHAMRCKKECRFTGCIARESCPEAWLRKSRARETSILTERISETDKLSLCPTRKSVDRSVNDSQLRRTGHVLSGAISAGRAADFLAEVQRCAILPPLLTILASPCFSEPPWPNVQLSACPEDEHHNEGHGVHDVPCHLFSITKGPSISKLAGGQILRTNSASLSACLISASDLAWQLARSDSKEEIKNKNGPRREKEKERDSERQGIWGR